MKLSQWLQKFLTQNKRLKFLQLRVQHSRIRLKQLDFRPSTFNSKENHLFLINLIFSKSLYYTINIQRHNFLLLALLNQHQNLLLTLPHHSITRLYNLALQLIQLRRLLNLLNLILNPMLDHFKETLIRIQHLCRNQVSDSVHFSIHDRMLLKLLLIQSFRCIPWHVEIQDIDLVVILDFNLLAVKVNRIVFDLTRVSHLAVDEFMIKFMDG